MNTMIPKSILFGAPMNLIMDGIRDEATTGNTSDVLVPEAWVREALVQTSEKRVASHLVWTDFSEEVARFGQIIHTHRPADMVASRKRDGQNVKTSAATVENVDIVLNQWIHQSFVIYDAEASLTFKELVTMHLVPAAKSVAQMIDEVVCNQVYQFVGASESGSLDAPITKATIINTRRRLQNANVDPAGMSFLVGPDSEAQILSIDSLTEVNAAGDAGAALRNAVVGRLFGFIFYMTQNIPSVPEMAGSLGATIDGPQVRGATAIDLEDVTVAIVAGQWIKIGGVPRRVASVGSLVTTAQSVVLEVGISATITDGTAVTVYEAQAVDGTYLFDYIDDVRTQSGFADDIARGQLVSFGTIPGVYGTVASPDTVLIIGSESAYVPTTDMTLDSPIFSTIANGTVACLGPEGNYNFAFHRNAVAMVSRPPAPPQAGMGVRSFSAALNGVAMRASITYDGIKQGVRVTLDTFVGVKTMDSRYGSVCYANNDQY